jgi:hypothetical protein
MVHEPPKSGFCAKTLAEQLNKIPRIESLNKGFILINSSGDYFVAAPQMLANEVSTGSDSDRVTSQTRTLAKNNDPVAIAPGTDFVTVSILTRRILPAKATGRS